MEERVDVGSLNHERKLKMCLCIGFITASICIGCYRDECEPIAMKCNDNRLMECSPGEDEGFEHSRWVEVMDCADYNSQCRVGEYIHFNPSSADYYESRNEFAYRSHGCAVGGVVCDGDTDLQCSEANTFIFGCSYSHDPAAMIIAENKLNHPLCVERSNGLAGFAYLDGECESNIESTCLEGGVTQVACDNGVWSLLGGNCARLHGNSRCAVTTDSEGYRSSRCVPIEQDTAE